MRFVAWKKDKERGLAVRKDRCLYNLGNLNLQDILFEGEGGIARANSLLSKAPQIDESSITYCPPLSAPPKIICVGLNYADHTAESKFEQPAYPTIFTRFASSFVGNNEPIIRPACSEQLDYEGELVAVIGKRGRNIPKGNALDFVAGYSIFNDASIRDYQMMTPQWTIGKNFDGTGAFGPDFVTADEVSPGAKGLNLKTRLNGTTLQSSSTDLMITDVATLVSILSNTMTLEVGDVLVTGTPSGVGFARNPQIFMREGDICEIEIDGIGVLRNPIKNEISG
jgi:acylpyruvate hydrolase